MTITAKFRSTCPVCGQFIHAGDRVEWVKGTPAVHARCHGKAATKPATTAPRTRNAQPALQTGEQYVSRPSRGRDDEGYRTGATYRFSRISGGGLDGHYWTVTASGKYRVSEAQDDTREGEWDCWGHIRPATDAEATPVAVRVAEAAARKTEVDDLRKALRASYGAETHVDTRPDGSTELWAEHRMGGSEAWHLAPDGVVYYVRSDYDMGPTTWRTSATVEQVERAKALGLRPNLLP